MKIGKISEAVLKRSVLSQIHTRREEVLLGASVGEDCAAVAVAEDEMLVISTDPITGTVQDIGDLAIQITVNDLASAGAEPVGVMLTVLLPERVSEQKMRLMMEQAEAACANVHVQIMGGHTEVTRVVNQPLISVVGVGKAKKGKLISTAGARPGMDIIITKWIGIEGTSILAKEKEEELLTRFAPSFLKQAKEFDQMLSVLPEAMIAREHAVAAMHDVTEGGIFGALWE
ncbi:MAG: hydrogenase maturation factor, partial [Eubacterium sp.]|nr:hydrogenase maturation factor [Eubacterium sp.]